MLPRSLFPSPFPVFCGRGAGGGIERLKRPVPAGRPAGERDYSEKARTCFIYMQTHTGPRVLPGSPELTCASLLIPVREKLTIGPAGESLPRPTSPCRPVGRPAQLSQPADSFLEPPFHRGHSDTVCGPLQALPSSGPHMRGLWFQGPGEGSSSGEAGKPGEPPATQHQPVCGGRGGGERGPP